MGHQILTFGNIEIEIKKLYGHKNPIYWGCRY